MSEEQPQQRKPYPSDLTDEQWAIILPMLPKPRRLGRKRSTDMREVFNAIFYLNKTGCPWEYLPHDFPPYRTVYEYFARFRDNGLLRRIHDQLRIELRIKEGRKPTASVAIVDSQSARTTAVGGPERGFDAGKKVKGRKRHIITDTLGLLLAVVVTAASVQDRDAVTPVVQQLDDSHKSGLRQLWADGGYQGEVARRQLERLAPRTRLRIVKRSPDAKGFQVLPKRWIVERTFAWTSGYRRLSKDYERLPRSSEGFFMLAMTHQMLRRLA